jgi:hypothetical protein
MLYAAFRVIMEAYSMGYLLVSEEFLTGVENPLVMTADVNKAWTASRGYAKACLIESIHRK